MMSFFSNHEQRKKIGVIIQILALLLLSFFILSTVFPQASIEPNVDHYVYQYVAQHILDGQTPYRDLWDHKGVLIYLIYAFSLLIDPNYGLWILSYFALALTSIGFSFLLQKVFKNKIGSFLTTLVVLWYLGKLLDGGNSVEFFNIPFQLLSFYAIWQWIKTKRLVFIFLLGAAAGLSFLLRPNEAFLALAFVFFLVFFKREKLVKNLFALVLGGIVAVAPFLLWLYQNQALKDFYDIVWRFNFLYSTSFGTTFKRFAVLVISFEKLSLFFVITLATYVFVVLRRKEIHLPESQNDFLNFLLLAFPITLAAELLSARPYLHYFISWLWVLGFFLAFSLSRVPHSALSNLLAGFFFLWIGAQLKGAWFPLIQSFWDTGSPPPLVDTNSLDNFYVNYITTYTDENTPVWVWGNNLKYNLLSDRDVPTKYLHIVPVVNTAYTHPEDIDGIIRDLELDPPLILDITAKNFSEFSISSEKYDTDPVLYPLVQYIRQNYYPNIEMGPYGWTIWVPR